MDKQYSVPKIPIVKVPKTNGEWKSSAETKSVKINLDEASGKSPIEINITNLTDNDTERSKSTMKNEFAKWNAPHASNASSTSLQSSSASLSSALCPQCSHVLINYLTPLEKYIKDILNKTIESSTGVKFSQLQKKDSQKQFKYLDFNSELKNVSTTKQTREQTIKQTVEETKEREELQRKNSSDSTLLSKVSNINIECEALDLDNLSINDNAIQYSNIDDNKQPDIRDSAEVSFSQNIPASAKYDASVNESQSLENNSTSKSTSIPKSLSALTSALTSSSSYKYGNAQKCETKQQNNNELCRNVESNNNIISNNISNQGIKYNENNKNHSKESDCESLKNLQNINQYNNNHASSSSSNNHASPLSLFENKIFFSKRNTHQIDQKARLNNNNNLNFSIQNSSSENLTDNNVYHDSPYAYSTIVVDNLSALNAILLVNSLHFYNNHNLVITANEESDNFVNSKIILARYYIPAIVFIDGTISAPLLEILANIYDEIVELNTTKSRLLDSHQYGIVHRKIHLWKELCRFQKCIFLDSSILVVGNISSLFLNSSELSACVECFYPDHFNCSVLVFEPNEKTFRAILQFGLQQKLNADGYYESCDEATLLNAYFATKWNRLSFVYNFTRFDHTYTQIPAYLKFCGQLKAVNFQQSSDQPWNFKFNLAYAQTEANPFELASTDNYIKFYLRLFMCRVWPMLSNILTQKILQSHQNKIEWTVSELMHILSPDSNSVWQLNPITLRRKSTLTKENILQNKTNINALQANTALLPESSDTPLEYSPDSLENNIHNDNNNNKNQHNKDQLQEQTIITGENNEKSNQHNRENIVNACETKKTKTSTTEKEDEKQNLRQNEKFHENVQQKDRFENLSDKKIITKQNKQNNEWSESMDWLGDMQSDQIIKRLKALFRN